jgi:hypothetical protein
VVVVVVDAVVVDADVVVVDSWRAPASAPVADEDPSESRVAQTTAPARATDAATRIPSRARLRTRKWCHVTLAGT